MGKAGLEKSWTEDGSDGEHEIFLFFLHKGNLERK